MPITSTVLPVVPNYPPMLVRKMESYSAYVVMTKWEFPSVELVGESFRLVSPKDVCWKSAV